jgi:chemotaxis family two-component system response regulator Rcp1
MTDPFVILLVEDNPADVRLTQEALKIGKVMHELVVVTDGAEAMTFLHKRDRYVMAPRPELILLDLNLPRKDGWEVLVEIKSNPLLTSIPVIILTASQADKDILATYDSYANGYIVKPVAVEQFFATLKNIKDYWMSVVMLPPKESWKKQTLVKAER